jgi:hypothetical protein
VAKLYRMLARRHTNAPLLAAWRCVRMSAICFSGAAAAGPRQADAAAALPLDAVFVVPGDEIFVDHEGGFLKCVAGEGTRRG